MGKVSGNSYLITVIVLYSLNAFNIISPVLAC